MNISTLGFAVPEVDGWTSTHGTQSAATKNAKKLSREKKKSSFSVYRWDKKGREAVFVKEYKNGVAVVEN